MSRNILASVNRISRGLAAKHGFDGARPDGTAWASRHSARRARNPIWKAGVILAGLGLLSTAAAAANDNPGFEQFRARHYCPILLYLQAIYSIPGVVRHRYLVAEPAVRKESYLQCLIAPDRTGVVCEAASGHWLRPPRQLISTDRLPVLLALGFDPEPGDGNYRLGRPIADEGELRQIAELYIHTFYDVYELSPDAALRLKAPLVRRPPAIRQPLDSEYQPYTS